MKLLILSVHSESIHLPNMLSSIISPQLLLILGFDFCYRLNIHSFKYAVHLVHVKEPLLKKLRQLSKHIFINKKCVNYKNQKKGGG